MTEAMTHELRDSERPDRALYTLIKPSRSNSVPPELLTDRYAPVVCSGRRRSFDASTAVSIFSDGSDVHTTPATSVTSDDVSVFYGQEECDIHSSTAGSSENSTDASKAISLSPKDLAQKLTPASVLLGHLPLCSELEYVVIDSTPLLQVAPIFDDSAAQPSFADIFVNIDGPGLGRQGAVATLAIYRWSHGRVFILDIAAIGQAAFYTSLVHGQTLQEVMQSKSIHKVFFDARSAADALHCHFGVTLCGVIEVQLLEFAARRGMATFLKGLSKCVQGNFELTRTEREDFQSTRENLRSSVHLECGAEEPLLCSRPLQRSVIALSILDVTYIASIWDYYDRQVRLGMMPRIVAATEARIAQSCALDYNGQGRHMARGPW